MNLQEGSLLYITPFYYLNGCAPQNKFFLCIKNVGADSILISLPTSQDYVPEYHQLLDGCNDIQRAQQCFYCFLANNIVCSDTKFSFNLNTYLFGHQVQNVETAIITNRYKMEGTDYEICGTVDRITLNNIIECFKNSSSIPKRVIKLL